MTVAVRVMMNWTQGPDRDVQDQHRVLTVTRPTRKVIQVVGYWQNIDGDYSQRVTIFGKSGGAAPRAAAAPVPHVWIDEEGNQRDHLIFDRDAATVATFWPGWTYWVRLDGSDDTDTEATVWAADAE